MRVAAFAQYLGAGHEEAAVGFGHDVFRCDGRPEARPSGAGVEFGIRAEERGSATYAAEDALLMPFVIFVREWRFGACLARDLVLLRRQLAFPFCVGLHDFVRRDGSLLFARVAELDDRYFLNLARRDVC